MKRTLAYTAAFGLILSLYASAQSAAPQVTVLGNSIDIPLSTDTLDTMRLQGVDATTISAQELRLHQNDPLILILGGQNSPEGVGEIVGGILNISEQEELVSSPYARTVQVYPNLWCINQTVVILAGYSKEQTHKAFADSAGDIVRILTQNGTAISLGNETPTTGIHPTLDFSQLKVC
ncbi:Uncharacterised protein [uncultured archaeon]|nr:Uncharacterised protein [uncultured archaeon]